MPALPLNIPSSGNTRDLIKMKFNTFISDQMNRNLTAALLLIFSFVAAHAQEVEKETGAATDKEEDYYRIFSLPVPEHVILEVGGLASMADGALAVCTRRGEVWIVSNPYVIGSERPVFK